MHEKYNISDELDYEKSALYDVIRKNENYLYENAFKIVFQDKNGERYCSGDEAGDIFDETTGKVVLYFSDGEYFLKYDSVISLKKMLRKCSFT